MSLSFYIIDDDAVCRRMLQNIIEASEIGEVVGTAEGGVMGSELIPEISPDVVLIDLLMPDLDGIETIVQLKNKGFNGKFVMISQIVNKEMVEQAYRTGVDFFIHKPINRIEVETVLKNVREQIMLNRSLFEIKRFLSKLDTGQPAAASASQERSVREIVQHILMDMGITGEGGSKDIISIMEYLEQGKTASLPPLKDLYEAVARHYKQETHEVAKETKAIEQRIRRAVMAALTHLASLGLTDYANPKFEYYAPLYFDFQVVRLKMKEIDDDMETSGGKVNIKKFLQVLYLETREKMKGSSQRSL